ncbi:peptide chain release factor 3 [Chitinispirillales bacterium ANBcel5]|uniref:peptide chain release factor 3 n=1 Tax=Cellulosispirillum alkaliphilum TaxID=3039283 RepID=UPI002A56115C|nr:peptide chain release factor 3 [Chitinispirillales bacterium ANBcel5]
MTATMSYQKEISKRRTFAIVSHPDAGKTTLTEKFLLYGGALQLAGSVTSRKKERATVSDWMELERKRGISVSSTVLNFKYRGYSINLLDTPGHNDFSEDTYRVLTAVDSVIMVIDGGKGIEQQTKKLFEVCRRRKTPVFTFVNKMDRPALNSLSILDEIERVLNIEAYAINWPLGSGPDFKGVWDRESRLAHLFERTERGSYKAPVKTHGFDDPYLKELLNESTYAQISEELEMIEHAGVDFNAQDVLEGKTTPVFFGSATNNFGIEALLDSFIEHSPQPQPRHTDSNTIIKPDNPSFSGFVFKIQANMDPRHRDRMAFVRIVSGKFTRDMQVTHNHSGKKLRLSNSSNVFGRERISVDEAYPGDVIGIVGGNYFSIGDTLSEDNSICFNEIPRFPPECFSFIHNPVPANYKRFQSGLTQLLQEGLIHFFELADSARKTPVLGAVGILQFDLVKHRMETEYGTKVNLEKAPWTMVRWICEPSSSQSPPRIPHGVQKAVDEKGAPVLLFTGEWHLKYFEENNKGIELNDFRD